MRVVSEQSLASQLQTDVSIPGLVTTEILPGIVHVMGISYLPCGEQLIVVTKHAVVMLNACSLDVVRSSAIKHDPEEDLDGMQSRGQWVQDLECAPDGLQFAIGMECLSFLDWESSSAVELWDVQLLQSTVRKQLPGKLSKLTFVPARKHLAAILQDRVYILETDSLGIVEQISLGESVRVTDLAHAPDGTHLFLTYADSATKGGHVACLNAESYAIVEAHQCNPRQNIFLYPTSCSFTPDSQLMLIGTSDGHVCTWRVRPFEMVQQKKLSAGRIDQLGGTSNESQLIVSSRENNDWSMHTVDVHSLEVLNKWTVSCGWSFRMAFPPCPPLRHQPQRTPRKELKGSTTQDVPQMHERRLPQATIRVGGCSNQPNMSFNPVSEVRLVMA